MLRIATGYLSRLSANGSESEVTDGTRSHKLARMSTKYRQRMSDARFKSKRIQSTKKKPKVLRMANLVR